MAADESRTGWTLGELQDELQDTIDNADGVHQRVRLKVASVVVLGPDNRKWDFVLDTSQGDEIQIVVTDMLPQ